MHRRYTMNRDFGGNDIQWIDLLAGEGVIWSQVWFKLFVNGWYIRFRYNGFKLVVRQNLQYGFLQHVALNKGWLKVRVFVSILRVLTLLLNRPRWNIDQEKGILLWQLSFGVS